MALEWVTADTEDEAGASEASVVPALPALPALSAEERVALDYQLLGLSARRHPMGLRRRELRRRGIRSIAELADLPERRVVRVAGWVISAQRPPTAKGMGFVVLEDETGDSRWCCRRGWRRSCTRCCGRLERVRWYRAVLASELRTCDDWR